MVDVRKRLVRDLQDARPGMKHTEAVRSLDQAAALRPDPPLAWARLVPDQDRGSAGITYWKAEYRPIGGTWGARFSPSWVLPTTPTFAAQLLESFDLEGWTYPGPWPADAPNEAMILPLWRSERGQREDDLEAIYKAVGKTYHSIQELYAAAVADALDRAGISVSDYWADPNEPRELTLQLEFAPGGYEELYIAWREDRGWYWVPYSDAGEALGDFAKELDCDFLALPDDVAAAVLNGATSADKPATESCLWTPPDGYKTNPNPPRRRVGLLRRTRRIAGRLRYPPDQPLRAGVSGAQSAGAAHHA
ncbi:DUF6292 family protein [Nonomuraea sp. NPDC049400]|uniref:DUF6292 family protein n=1 Tax=Nonomuraea sp. NPDC049400 TaxID=3364352 RepID=UPI0037AF694D